MKKKEIITVLAVAAVSFIVLFICIWKTNLVVRILEINPFGISNEYHREKGNQDLEKGREYTIEYVKEKYGFEPEITYIQPVMSGLRSDILPIFRRTYSGSVLCECCINGVYFNAVIRISDKAGCDNYQKEEIMSRIEEEVQKIEGLEYKSASYNSDLFPSGFKLDDEAIDYIEENNRTWSNSNYAEELYDENTDLKEFLKPLNFRMNLHSDVDLEEIDNDALCRMFPEEGVDIYKRFPEGEHWGCFSYQQRKYYWEYGDTEIRKYAPKLVGVTEVSACDGSDFSIEAGIILQGEWEGNRQIKFDPVESPVYTCRFDGYKEVEFGLLYDWWVKSGMAAEIDICYMFYQYRDETGKIRCNGFSDSGTRRVYTDMLTIMYAKKEK